VRIVLRAASGFARDTLMAWCEQNRVDYLFGPSASLKAGLARNVRLVAEIEAELAEAVAERVKTGHPVRRFKDFTWRTRDSWNCERRVVGKAEGPVRISVCGRAVEHYAAVALMKRSPKTMANRALALDHSRGGISHSFPERFKIR
jgi:hypothetical protein